MQDVGKLSLWGFVGISEERSDRWTLSGSHNIGQLPGIRHLAAGPVSCSIMMQQPSCCMEEVLTFIMSKLYTGPFSESHKEYSKFYWHLPGASVRLIIMMMHSNTVLCDTSHPVTTQDQISNN